MIELVPFHNLQIVREKKKDDEANHQGCKYNINKHEKNIIKMAKKEEGKT